MLRAFKMEVGKDYKVISFQGEPERIAALINGDVDAVLISVPHAPRAISAGMKVLVRTGDYIQRAGGSIWTRKVYVDEHPDAVKKFIRAIAKGVMYLPRQQGGSIATLKEHLGVANDKDAEIVWEETHNTFGAELPNGAVPRNLRVAPSRHDRRQAMGAGQAAARSGAVPGARAARPDAQGHELRADQARRPDALRCRSCRKASAGTGGVREDRVMRTLRAAGLAVVVALSSGCGAAQAQTKITVGKVVGGVGLHIPSYIAMDKGFFKEEGLDARFVELAGRPLMTAGLSGNLDFVPIPSGGAQAVLKRRRAPLHRRPVAEVAMDHRHQAGDQEGRGPQGQDARLRPRRRRRLRRGRDHAGSLLQHEGRPRLQGDPVPGRAGADRGAGQRRHRRARWSRCRAPTRPSRPASTCCCGPATTCRAPAARSGRTEEFFQKNPETVKKFIRAIAKGVMYYRDNKEGSYATHEGAPRRPERRGGGRAVGRAAQHLRAPSCRPISIREIFESRRLDMIAANQWPKDKPLPDPEQYPGARRARWHAEGDELRADQARAKPK